MARFYFQSNAWGTTFEDHQGIEHADLDAARQDANRLAREFMNCEAAKGTPCPSCCFDVVSVAGSNVMSVLPVQRTT